MPHDVAIKNNQRLNQDTIRDKGCVLQFSLTAYDPTDLPGGSIDPLGFERGYLFLADKILPGLTNVASRPRYFSVLLEGEPTVLAYLGSANFTARGWGFLESPQGANVEAGFMFHRHTDEANLLRSLIPPTTGATCTLGRDQVAGAAVCGPG